MNPIWREQLLQAGAAAESAALDFDHFGDSAGELKDAAEATVMVPLSHLGLIEITGDDAKSFLHNQLTSDINHLGLHHAQNSAWCSAKGRMLASFILWRQGDAYRLATAGDLVDELAKRFRMYILRAKAKVADLSATILLIGLAGPRAGEALSAAGLPIPGEPLTTMDAGENKVIRLDTERFLLAVPADGAASLWTSLAKVARPAGLAAWRWLDVKIGFPLVTAATKEEFVPQMADFDKMGGVSFHKGCYPGQEVVARTQYLGKVKRHLYRVASTTPLKPGESLHSPDNPDQASGMVVTAAPSPQGGFVALAVVQANFSHSLRAGTLDGSPVSATPVNS